MVIASATSWGLSGTAAQILFTSEHVHPIALVDTRMTFAGLLLLLYGAGTRKKGLLDPWKTTSGRRQLMIFAIVGLLGVQYTYFAAIATGNAASATLLQYLGPSVVIGFTAIRSNRWPAPIQLIALSTALIGTFLLITNGSLGHLEIPLVSLTWGLLSALTLAFYTMYPVRLIKSYGSIATVGWGLVIGGLTATLWSLPVNPGQFTYSLFPLVLIGFIVVFGTAIPFGLYLASLHHLTPAETSLSASAEPISAAVAAVSILHVHLGLLQIVGGAAIVAAVTLVARNQPTEVPMSLP